MAEVYRKKKKASEIRYTSLTLLTYIASNGRINNMRKTLKNNREVAHIWAQQRQSEGKSGNMFFEGATIYSYGHHFPIARFARPDTVLLTSNRYSVSTAKHINYTRQALRGGLTVLEVSDVSANTNGDHLQNLVRLGNEYNVWVEKAKRNRAARGHNKMGRGRKRQFPLWY